MDSRQSTDGVEVVTASERPDLAEQAATAFRERWPEFIFHDEIPPLYMPRVESYFADYEILLLVGGRVAAGGWGVALDWDGTPDGLPGGYRTALVQSVEEFEQGRAPTAFSFMAAAVAEEFDKQGLAGQVLRALAERASRSGISQVIAPIRPTWKKRYPNWTMSEYATWKRADGFSVDPWIRTHQRMGATIIKPAPDSMVVTAPIEDWERWTEMLFPVTGNYVVPDALNLVAADRETGLATYREENLWVQHELLLASAG